MSSGSWNTWKWQNRYDTSTDTQWRNQDQWQGSRRSQNAVEWADYAVEEDDDAADASTSSGIMQALQPIGTRWVTNVHIPGPFFTDGIPQELYDNCSITSCQRIEQHVRQWQDQEEKRNAQCLPIALENNCGYFILERLKKHFQRLRELEISFSVEEDHEEDPFTEVIPQHVLGFCVECTSVWHVGTPPGFCPNDLTWAEYKKNV